MEDYLIDLRSWVDDTSGNRNFNLKIYTRERFHSKAYIFEKKKSHTSPSMQGIVGSSNLSLSGLAGNTELNAKVYDNNAEALKSWFMEIWKEADEFSENLFEILDKSWASYLPGTEGFPDPYFVYIKTIYEMYKGSLETSEEILRSFIVYQNLYEFQKWAVLRAIEVARKYNGVIISDVVGMGKSYIGAACLEHFYQKNQILGRRGKILLICPPKLMEMWEGIINKFHLNAQLLSLGMLSKEGFDETLLDKYANTISVLIDESHHFRNNNTNRYDNITQFLPIVNEVILLTATPYSKGARDVYNQIKLFHLDDITNIPINPPNLKEFTLNIEKGHGSLSELLTHVMVRRTRYDILNQYGINDKDGRDYVVIGGENKYFPERKLKTKRYSISKVYGKGFYDEIVDILRNLTYSRYSLGNYLKKKYETKEKYRNLPTIGNNLRGLMKSLLLKRLESSIYSFKETLRKMINTYNNFLNLIKQGKVVMGKKVDQLLREEEDLADISDRIDVLLKSEEIEDYDLKAFDEQKLKKHLNDDLSDLNKLYLKIKGICEEIQKDYKKDKKIWELRGLVESLYSGKNEIIAEPIEKIIIFSQYSDTIDHLKGGLKWFKDNKYLNKSLRIDFVTSDTNNVQDIIDRFAPNANNVRDSIDSKDEIDLLASTDVLSEGINLQDANCVINYDLHWNPLKLIQRIGRVDRLGTKHEKIFAFNFLPEKDLEKDLNLIDKLEARINEINDVFGMDSKLLKEDEQPNLSYMTSIYKEDLEEIEKYERTILIGDDPVSDSINLLKKLMQKDQELINKIKGLDGLRSAKKWEQSFDGIFVLCKASDYIRPYLIKFEKSKPEIHAAQPEIILKTIKSEPEEKALNIDRNLFRKYNTEACQKAIYEFKKDLKERKKLIDDPRKHKRLKSKRRYVERHLRVLAENISDEEQKKTINHYRTIIHNISIVPVLREFEKIEEKKLTGKEIFLATESLIQKYNLEEKWEKKKELMETFDEPVHILCGMYLKGE
ncbi:MAG: helicase SNF2 [Candidatus Lokiarchaeota archaeon]|nr:helicase SNF2 [Candidatus Lokiarchaeota archaeon]